MKKVLKILILFLALFIGYFAYKLVLVNKVNSMLNDDMINVDKIDNIEDIKINKNNDYKELFEYGNFTLRNDYKDFKQDSNVNNIYTLKDDYNTAIGFYEDSSLLDLVKRFLEETYKSKNNYIFVKYNIKSDVDLYKFMANYDKGKVNLFDSITKIKEKELVYTIIGAFLSTYSNIYTISGDFDGYIVERASTYNVAINYLGKQYVLLFANKNYFTLDKIKEIISTLKLSDGNRVDMYKLGNYSIYADEEDPKFINDQGIKVSIKEFLESSNCTVDCIHSYSDPIKTLKDGGSKVYKYKVENQTYYMIECNKMGSRYNNGRDILIGKDLDKLVNYC